MPFDRLILETLNTLYMVGVSSLITLLFGLPLGLLLYFLDHKLFFKNRLLYFPIALLVNFARATPFAIFIIVVIPLTRALVGTTLGTTASIVPLSLGAIPFFARLVEGTCKSTRTELIELCCVYNHSKVYALWHLVVLEKLPQIIRDFTQTVVTIISYSALAGLIGGGGLGKVAIQYGYQRYDFQTMSITLALLLLIVQLAQWGGECMARVIEKKRGLR